MINNNMEKKEPIYMDQDGLNNLLAEIEDIKNQLAENDLGRKQAFDAGSGDGWDSPEFEEIGRREQLLMGLLKRRSDELKRVVLVEKSEDASIIDIGDIVVVDMILGPNNKEELIFKLIGGAGGGLRGPSGYPEVSINSPLGKAVYQNVVGGTGSYQVNGNVIGIEIKEKRIEEELKP